MHENSSKEFSAQKIQKKTRKIFLLQSSKNFESHQKPKVFEMLENGLEHKQTVFGMKKIEAVVFSALIVILSWQASAMVGVSPGIYEVDFEPGLKESYLFSYMFDDGVKASVYAEGDLAKYVKLSTDSLVGGGQVIATVELPDYIEEPGNHKIFIGAMQKADEGEGIGMAGNVRGVILVKVPYPGKYASLSEFYVDNANQGEPVNLTLVVNNLGKEGITVNAFVEIFDDSDSSIEIVNIGNAYLDSKEEKTFRKQLQTTNYKAGDYRAKAIVKYDAGELTKEQIFRLGTLYVGISNYTEEFQRDKLNQMDIEVESFWNNPIRDVYGEVQIIGHDIKFLTPSITLNPWKKQQISGFFDASEIKEKNFQANITINYEGEKTSKIVELKFKKETDYVLYALVGGGVFLGILIISLIIAMVILLIRMRKNEKPSPKQQFEKNDRRIK
ncbi:hypothetical protein A3K73_01165 [Candidatus Pacearchaeota archaeon RBG_13_36_9]|nr:MAG: hypothetical protein A3K73_01165 [Candidatus Pacearchaeota archaeon RBG_13_36_9]